MIPPTQQWACQIETTNACHRKCSNCTRLTAHVRTPFHISVADFGQAVATVADFPTDSEPDLHGREKVIGLIGGEPLLHPEFETLCQMFVKAVPRREHRGLWTGMEIAGHKFGPLVGETFGYVNLNTHTRPCYHQPVLVGIREVAQAHSPQDPETWMWEQIDNCWLQRLWAGSVTPKGFFFCEVAAALDVIFDGPGGLPVNENCWRRDLGAFREQIERWCPRCGIPLTGLRSRRDTDRLDDISAENLRVLRDLGSPRVARGEYRLFAPKTYELSIADGAQPWRYLR